MKCMARTERLGLVSVPAARGDLIVHPNGSVQCGEEAVSFSNYCALHDPIALAERHRPPGRRGSLVEFFYGLVIAASIAFGIVLVLSEGFSCR